VFCHKIGIAQSINSSINSSHRSPAKLIDHYAQRMLIENGIADSIDCFHMDALSSAVAMKVNCVLQLTLMASTSLPACWG
jgi:hypothetical protein